MATRVIDGPEKDVLDMADLVHLLRLSEKTIRRLIDAGEFPQPLEQTPQSRTWAWDDVVYWFLRVKLRPRLVKKQKPETPNKAQPGPTTGQPGPTGARDDLAD